MRSIEEKGPTNQSDPVNGCIKARQQDSPYFVCSALFAFRNNKQKSCYLYYKAASVQVYSSAIWLPGRSSFTIIKFQDRELQWVSLASRRLNRGDNCNCHARLATKDKLTMSPPTFPIWGYSATQHNLNSRVLRVPVRSTRYTCKIPRTYHHWIDGCSLQHLVPAGSDRICSLCDAESTPSMLVNLRGI